MNNSAAGRRSPLGLFPGRLAPLPDALARKYPNAGREWGWQWVFPASSHIESWGARGPQAPRPSAESRVQRAWRGYPD